MTTVKEIGSVRNACRVLEAIARDQPAGVSELARTTGIDKSAVHRIAVTLASAGWLEHRPDGSWQLDRSLASLIQPASTASLIADVRPVLEQLRDETNETAMLVTIEHGRLLVLDVVDSRHNLRITAPAGSELPIERSSAAQAIGAHLPAEQLRALRDADPTLDDALLAATRRRGWAINDRAIVPEACVVGAAVLASSGTPLGAIIVCAPSTRMNTRQMQAIGATVARAARSVHQRRAVR